ncbi:MAG: hypothetical protein AAB691_03630 [Patescibacteria group bacterium]
MAPMSEEDQKKNVQEVVLEQIKEHKVSMHSKSYFMLHAVLFGVGVTLIFLALIYLGSFIIFGLIQSGVWFVPTFGLRGWFIFFRSLPWILILLVFIFALVLEIMVRRYSFAYRRPLLYSMLGIVGLVILGGFCMSRFNVHRELWQYGRANRLPLVHGFYRQFGAPRFRDVHRGIVRMGEPSGFILENDEGETSTVMITPQTRFFRFRDYDFVASDTVIIYGDRDGRIIRAYGIKNIGQ